MPAAARVGDLTNHGGSIKGPGVSSVLIGGMPAVVSMDIHSCSLPPNTHQPTVSPFPVGSKTVMISGRPAIRVGDSALCGASTVIGEPTVQIGG